MGLLVERRRHWTVPGVSGLPLSVNSVAGAGGNVKFECVRY